MTAPLRILHLHSGNLYGGVESQLIALASMQNYCGIESSFALCFDGRLSKELGSLGAEIHWLGPVRFRKPWTIWRARRNLRTILAQFSFDAVVCHSCWSLALFARMARRHRQPLIYWAHDIPRGDHWLERRAMRIPPDLVLANSRTTLEAMPVLFPAVRVELQPVFVRIPASHGFESIRRQLETPSDAVVILMASRLERLKGHGVLLDALARLATAENWQCWIAGGAQKPGEQQYLDRLVDRVRSRGLASRVRFLGQRGDIPALMAAADIYCQPNVEPESFGLTFVEALFAGLPVVTSAIGGALEIVDETCGRLTPAGDSAAVAAALDELIRNAALRLALGGAGRNRARDRFTPDAAVRALHDHLASVQRPSAAEERAKDAKGARSRVCDTPNLSS
jgi:glycosyltransferase involved in cell wall biosynthesis